MVAKYKAAWCRRLILARFAGMRGSIARAVSACSLFGHARLSFGARRRGSQLRLGWHRACSPSAPDVLPSVVDLAPVPSDAPCARWWPARLGFVPVAGAGLVARPTVFCASVLCGGGRAFKASGFALGRACAFLRSRFLFVFSPVWSSLVLLIVREALFLDVHKV